MVKENVKTVKKGVNYMKMHAGFIHNMEKITQYMVMNKSIITTYCC